MSSRFFEQLAQIKAVVSGSMTVEQKLAQVQPILSDQDLEREFWNLLDDERWVAVLKEAGVFEHPPFPETAESGTRYPYWGASKYLARVASRVPSEVASVFSGMETKNVAIIGDMLDAAGAMPISDAALLVPAVRRVAADGSLWLHFKDASDLCVRLAEGGEVDLSLSLTEAFFASQGEHHKKGLNGTSNYWYKEGLKKVTPILATLRAQKFLPMLCDWLEGLIRSTKRIDDESGNDYSYIWRPAIEDHDQNREFDLVGVVVGCVRDGFEFGIRRGGTALMAALQLLGKRRLVVFRRLSLHLLAEFGEQEPLLVTQTILNRGLFDDHRLKHEYARLVTRRLAELDIADRAQWYRWVDEGPDMSGFDENVRRNLHREPTEDDRRSRIDYWRFQKLHWASEVIEGAHREFYERMLADHGTPEMADLNIRSGVGWDEQTPMTVGQLSAVTFEEALEKVSSWKPADAFGPSLHGLASTFGDYISRNPKEFSKKALSMQGCPSSFVSVYLRHMAAAVKEGREIELPTVLELCDWVVTQHVDDDWQSARDEISGLIRTACQATCDKTRPKFGLDEFRQSFWTLVQSLYRDHSKSYIVRDTSSDDLRVHDYLELGMNSARGRAVEASLDFARWVALHLTTEGGEPDSVPGGMKVIPELRELLEWQIEPENQSLEAMAIIGSRIGVIHWIDARWLANNADRLFNLDRVEQVPAEAFGWSAWNAFLAWVRPHIVFYHALHRQFHYAVRQAVLVEIDKQDHDQPMFRLGEHLLVLYGRGQLPLDDAVLQDFLSGAKPPIRRHAIGFVGSSLGHEPVPDDVIERFMALWDAYWRGLGKRDAEEDPDTVLFGSWFCSGDFPDHWALTSLHDFVGVVPVPKPEHLVMKRLAKVAHLDIDKSTRIVARMVRGDHEGWRMHSWQEPARAILEQAVKSGGTTRSAAEEIIDFLGRRGYTAFGTLLAS